MSRIVIVGGYGAFGAHAVERLAAEPNIHIVVAGRSRERAQACAEALRRTARANVSSATLDATRASSEEISALGANILINASGPFQDQRYELARACIEAGCHYIDLADARAFVTGIAELDAAARSANVCVISGASSVPGLSSVVVKDLARQFSRLEDIAIGISPGNSFDPGVATVASILGGIGKPFNRRGDGREETAYGWQGLHRRQFPGLGSRWMADVDVPDLDLLPKHHPSLRSARFFAGLEVGLFHLGLWSLSWLVRAGWVRNLKPLAGPLLSAKRALRVLGSDQGGMFVSLRGADTDGTRKVIQWTLVARSGHGPYVPALPSVILSKQLAVGAGPPPGARACLGLFTLQEFGEAVHGLHITWETSTASSDN